MGTPLGGLLRQSRDTGNPLWATDHTRVLIFDGCFLLSSSVGVGLVGERLFTTLASKAFDVVDRDGKPDTSLYD